MCVGVLERASVELRSVVRVNGPVVLEDVDSVVAGVSVEAGVLTEDGGIVVAVCTIAEVGRDDGNADVILLPVVDVVEELTTGALRGVVGMGVFTRCVVAPWAVSVAEMDKVAVIEVAGASVCVGVVISVVDVVGGLDRKSVV